MRYVYLPKPPGGGRRYLSAVVPEETKDGCSMRFALCGLLGQA
jgi:hypothetical protein